MKGKNFVAGAGFAVIFKVVFSFLKIVIEVVAKTVYFFGLYVPLAYLIYGGVLYAIFNLDLFDMSSNSLLYLFGLGLTVVIAGIISFKNTLVKPYKKYIEKNEIVDYANANPKKLSKRAPEAPKIYKSKANPGFVVYEYKDRFDLYEDSRDGLIFANREWKTKKEKRK